MPKYFFDIHEGVDFPDNVGSELPDIAAALTLACTSIAEILQDASRAGIPARCVATVRDESGTVLFTATAMLTIEMA